MLASDLCAPRYKISFPAAVRSRLLRNYWAIYAVLAFSWVLKVVVYPEEAHGWAQVKVNLARGMIPWWAPLLYLGLFFGVLAAIVILAPATGHPDEAADEFWNERAPEPGERPIDI